MENVDMTYQALGPETDTVELDATAFPIAIAEEILKLTKFLEIERDVVQYHLATAELRGLLRSLDDYRQITSDSHDWFDTQLEAMTIKFCVQHHYSHRSSQELAEQLLNVLHFWGEQ